MKVCTNPVVAASIKRSGIKKFRFSNAVAKGYTNTRKAKKIN
jgi:hypothetical protein